jgi:hypothetical protein
MMKKDISKIPDKYIIQRWRKKDKDILHKNSKLTGGS